MPITAKPTTVRELQNTTTEGCTPLLKFLQMTCNPAFCIALSSSLTANTKNVFLCYEDLHQVIHDWTMNRISMTGNKITCQKIWKATLLTHIHRPHKRHYDVNMHKQLTNYHQMLCLEKIKKVQPSNQDKKVQVTRLLQRLGVPFGRVTGELHLNFVQSQILSQWNSSWWKCFATNQHFASMALICLQKEMSTVPKFR